MLPRRNHISSATPTNNLAQLAITELAACTKRQVDQSPRTRFSSCSVPPVAAVQVANHPQEQVQA